MLFSLFSKSSLLAGKSFLPNELADPRRILLTHFGSTSDIVRSIPVLVALRHRFPYADIAWLINENAAPLVLDHWAVNRFIVVRNHWLSHLSEVRRVRQRLLSFAPQVVVDLQNTSGSAFASWLSNASYRIGFGGKQRRFFHNLRILAIETHQIERNLQLLSPFGVFGSSISFDMPECEKDFLTARNILQRKGLHGDFALINISAESQELRWHEERYGAVAKYLLDVWNLPSLVVWSGYEQEFRRAEAAVFASCGSAHQAPWTTLSERRSLAKLATIFIGGDVAELQLAAAVGTQCVGLFASPAARKNAPFGQEHQAIHVPQTMDRQKRKRATLLGWMDAIVPEMVCEKCDEVLTNISQPSTVPMPLEFSALNKVA